MQRQAEGAAAEAERLRGELQEAQARAEAVDREMQAAMAVVQVRRFHWRACSVASPAQMLGVLLKLIFAQSLVRQVVN